MDYTTNNRIVIMLGDAIAFCMDWAWSLFTACGATPLILSVILMYLIFKFILYPLVGPKSDVVKKTKVK